MFIKSQAKLTEIHKAKYIFYKLLLYKKEKISNLYKIKKLSTILCISTMPHLQLDFVTFDS